MKRAGPRQVGPEDQGPAGSCGLKAHTEDPEGGRGRSPSPSPGLGHSWASAWIDQILLLCPCLRWQRLLSAQCPL